MPITIDGDSGLSGVNGTAGTPALQGADSNTGIVFGTDTVQVSTGGSTRATVDNQGDIYIGGTTDANADFVFEAGTRVSFYRTLFFGGSASGSANASIAANGDIGTKGDVTFKEGTTSAFSLKITGANGDFKIRDEFNTSDRLSINNEGHTFVRGTTTNGTLSVDTSQGAATNKNLIVGGHSSSSLGSSTACIVVLSNGNVNNTNNSYGSLSDAKLKENIVDASSQWDDIKAMQVRNYNFKESTGQETHTQLGVIAQELETVSPGLVSDSPDRDEDGNDLGTVTKSVNYSVLYMKAVKALQEAQTRIEALETKVAALEAA
jgi:hypothetical protein